jgi:hypothetical protein
MQEAKIKELTQRAEELSNKFLELRKEKIKNTERLVELLLDITESAKNKEISLEEADHLFGMFICFNFGDKLKEIIFDGARLELREQLEKEPEEFLDEIEERIYNLKEDWKILEEISR